MNKNKMSILTTLAGLACLLSFATTGQPPPKKTRIDAAFKIFGEILFMSGLDTLNTFNGKEAFHINRELLIYGFDNNTKISAAWSSMNYELHKRVILFYEGNRVRHLDVRIEGGKPQLVPIEDERNAPLLQNGGPDAAVRRGNAAYFFKGCQMAVRRRHNDWDEPTDLAAGIPCNLDAAWRNEYDNDVSMLLRGNQVWQWYANGTVSGPVAFDSLYKLDGWVVQPADD